jgi:hypothetical protein
MNAKIILPFLLILLSTVGCNSVEPDDNGNGVDTTSHSFTFQNWTFGEHSSSVLNDVAIINDSSIWCVGEIYMNDSLGNPDPQAYNAVYWNGNEWEQKRITVNFRGNLITPLLEGAFAFSNTDIWFVGSLPIQGDGENWIIYDLRTTVDPNISLSKAWGSSSSDIYFVGRNGSIAHYLNGTWSKIESGTDLDIYDIWGDYNSTNGGYEIIAVAAKEFVTYDKKIFIITENSVQSISTDSIPYSIHGIWFKSGKKYFIVGDGLYSKNNIYSTTEWEWLHTKITNYYLYAIRGQQKNDLFTCGAFGEIIHYNGRTWKSFIESTNISNGAFNNLDFKEDIVVAVGYENPKAVITMGKR